MREIDFTMARQGLLSVGDVVEISEGRLQGAYYYTLEPALAMSKNYKISERLLSKKGRVVNITTSNLGYIVTVECEEE